MKIFFLLLTILTCSAQQLTQDILDKYIDIVWVIEGQEKAKVPFGIESIKVKGNNYKEIKINARRICSTTIKNNYKKWVESGRTNLFADFLGDRYCGPRGTIFNTRWKYNFKYYAKKENILF